MYSRTHIYFSSRAWSTRSEHASELISSWFMRHDYSFQHSVNSFDNNCFMSYSKFLSYLGLSASRRSCWEEPKESLVGSDRGKEFDWRELSSRMACQTIVMNVRTNASQFTPIGYSCVSEPLDAGVTYGNPRTRPLCGEMACISAHQLRRVRIRRTFLVSAPCSVISSLHCLLFPLPIPFLPSRPFFSASSWIDVCRTS